MPAGFANELIGDGLARSVTPTRGLVVEILTITVDSINTASAVVSVGLGVAACRRLARSMLAHRRASDQDVIKIAITRGKREPTTLLLHPTDPTAEDQLLEFLLTAIDGTDVT